ncbi:uncharacterized protein LOC141622440 [Silene latifolia]|uniref:uncharacterized protein LOC141622440 n=1 Tax=Silene latifolia TaxID=37657 RepID=UPI003D77A58C
MRFRTVPVAAFSVFAAAVFILSTLPIINADTPESNKELQFQWQLLSAKNFSSQIRLHPHVLLLVTVPWCGESRSLMRAISLKLAKEQQKYSALKLMLVYRNVDKVLADSLGAEKDITVLCYHHAVSYKYQGSLRVQDILSSVHHLVSLVPEELPLSKISNLEDMEMFLTSTDKAVLLLETCGWTSKLLTQLTANKTLQALQVLRGVNKERNITQIAGGTSKNDVGAEMMFCQVEDGCGMTPWAGKFSAENGTSCSRIEDMPTNFEASCSFSEYKKFESFFSKFIAAATDAYLPPQRQRYAFLSDKLLLSPLRVEVSDVWSLIISHGGCLDCVMKLKEETSLQDALAMRDQPVIELLEDENDLGPSLPIDKPSIVLFVDRRADSRETVKKSQEALFAFKEFAQQHWKLHTDGRSSKQPKKAHRTEKGSAGTYRSSKLVVSSASNKIKDKMSVVILKDGKYVKLDDKASELQSGSLHEILTHLLGEKKHSKLSSLAKEAGFQLLSDDIDIQIKDVVSSQTASLDEVAGSTVDNSPSGEDSEHLQHANIESSVDDNEHTLSVDLASKLAGLADSHKSFKDRKVDASILVDFKIQASVEADKLERLEHHYNWFTGSFYFSDGNDKFLRSLTNNLEVPSIVIIDPISEQHYVFSGEATWNFSSLRIIIDRFLNGSLTPYQRSGPLRKVIEMSRPPFVNLDFREKDSIPSVTTDTFSELVIGNGQTDTRNLTNAWHKDVVVLFSSSWCGFCQRMELVVREVYRALKGYVNLIKCDSKSKEVCFEENFNDVILKLPAIYSIDCTLNDCGWILKSAGQREVYPTLLLFPAKKKTAIPFNGNMIVTDVIKFLASHGVSSEHLARQKGTLWTEGIIPKNAYSKSPPPEEINHVRPSIPDIKSQNQAILEPDGKEGSRNLAAGSFLIASERLTGLNPFSQAKILIVGANPDLGFQGLIVNKPISWKHVLVPEDAELLKEAPVSFGGPVIHEGRPLVLLTRNSSNIQHPQVIPGVYFLDQLATINIIKEIKAGNQSACDYWFFWGYSGWSWDQLYNEINEGAWEPYKGSIEDLQWPENS